MVGPSLKPTSHHETRRSTGIPKSLDRVGPRPEASKVSVSPDLAGLAAVTGVKSLSWIWACAIAHDFRVKQRDQLEHVADPPAWRKRVGAVLDGWQGPHSSMQNGQ